MSVKEIIIRFATADDAHTICALIKGLAEYEREPDAVEATPESISTQLRLPQPPFECLLAEAAGEVRGFALFFYNYSTWRGKQGIHLEDLFVPEQHRGAGIGKLLLATLARIAQERGCPRLDWQVLDWNQLAIDFYEILGATVMHDWLPCRLQGSELSALATEGATVS
ncbi:MAG: GNAT family N-acetyltransferase [Actinomycetota bacterium]|nr:GNAT family N-acetyltransferase [Acidimicrobiaceae bacterium]MED5542357.1 GNAT family N-acetyltransferase [Actinomycetota bacterium]|tara:strand:+ start:1387 stop:1890 length:504 start_codon:yes stop_codon:yes gene_type:complete